MPGKYLLLEHTQLVMGVSQVLSRLIKGMIIVLHAMCITGCATRAGAYYVPVFH